MKTKLLLLFLFAANGMAFSQIELGIHAGLSQPNYYDRAEQYYDAQYTGIYSPTAGLQLFLNGKKHINWMAGLQYIRKKSDFILHYGPKPETWDKEIQFTLDHLLINLAMEYKLSWFYLQAGPYASWMFHSKREGEGNYSNIIGETDHWTIEGEAVEFSPLNMGLYISPGLRIPLGSSTSVQLGLPVYLGVINISQDYLKSYGAYVNSIDICLMAGIVLKI